jgi:type IV pilus assembly protein PilV
MRRAAAGFTVAEVFTAILVIAIGLIGIAALYGDPGRTTSAVEPRTQAEQLARTIAERVLANAAGRTGYASIVGVICPTDAKPPTRAVDAAAQEAACWQDEVQRALPNGTGSITRDLTTSPPTYVIAVSWSAPGAGAASYVIRVLPK